MDERIGKRVLYVSYDGLTDPLGQSQVLPYIIGLTKKGYQFTILSCEKPDRFAQTKSIIQRIADENDIHWVPVPYHKKPPVFSTIRDVRHLKKEAKRLQEEKGFGLVHCRSYIGSLIGIYLKRRYGVKYLFDMRGFWADEKVDAGAWRLGNPMYKTIYRYFKKKETIFVEGADQIISLTERGVNEMAKWKHVTLDRKKVTVIPCCADIDLFDKEKIDPKQQLQAAQKLGIRQDDVILSYLGSIGTWYMLDEMLDFFLVFKKNFPQARFLFITHGEHEHIINSATARGISRNDIILQCAKRSEVPVLASLSTFSIFFIRPWYSKAASSPTKQGELMALGIPVICNAGVGDTDSIIENAQSGVLVKNFSGEEYQRAIEELRHTTFDPEQIRKGAVDYFSLDKGVNCYLSVYRKMLLEKVVV